MILSAQSIRAFHGLVIQPFYERTVVAGMTFGLSCAGYDIRIKDEARLMPGDFVLATTVEYIKLPSNLMCQLADKSSWARRGIAVQNTIFEPGWFGYPTLEISNHGREYVRIPAAAPIGQLIFHMLDEPTNQPYRGKYQDQPQRPIAALEEEEGA